MSHQQQQQQQQPPSEASYDHLDYPMDSPQGNQDATKHTPENYSESDDDYYSRDSRDSVSRIPANMTKSLDGEDIDSHDGRDCHSPDQAHDDDNDNDDDDDDNQSTVAARDDQAQGVRHEHSHERAQATTTPDSNLPRAPAPHAQGQDGPPAQQLQCARCGCRMPPLEPALYRGQWLRSPSVSPRLPPPPPPAAAVAAAPPRHHHHHHQHQQLPAGPAVAPGRERYDSTDVEGFVYSVPIVSAPLRSSSGYYHDPSTHAQGAAARGYYLVQEEAEEDGPGAWTGGGDGVSLFYGPQRMIFRWHDPVVMMNNNNMGAYHQAVRSAAATTREEWITAGYLYDDDDDDEYATSRYYHGAEPAELDSSSPSSTSNLYFMPALDGYQVVRR